MSTYTFQLLALRKHRFSFTEGLASAFDYTPIINAYNVSPTPNVADARAIASDFIATGDDMRIALADYARTQCRNSPAPQGPRHIGEVIRQELHFQGPLPPPEAFAAYDRVLHGAADRILSMAENQASHRQGLERRALLGDLIKAMMGTILAYITFAGAMGGAVYLLANDKPLYGLAALVTALGAAFGPKIYADFIQPKATPPAPAQNS